MYLKVSTVGGVFSRVFHLAVASSFVQDILGGIDEQATGHPGKL